MIIKYDICYDKKWFIGNKLLIYRNARSKSKDSSKKGTEAVDKDSSVPYNLQRCAWRSSDLETLQEPAEAGDSKQLDTEKTWKTR